MTFLATCVVLCRNSMISLAADARQVGVDLSVPYRPKPFINVPALLMHAAAVSVVAIIYANIMSFWL